MARGDEPFVHVLLFRCPQCNGPISTAVPTDERNMEQTDSTSFSTNCGGCGWTGSHNGIEAKRHWVEPWGLGV